MQLALGGRERDAEMGTTTAKRAATDESQTTQSLGRFDQRHASTRRAPIEFPIKVVVVVVQLGGARKGVPAPTNEIPRRMQTRLSGRLEQAACRRLLDPPC